MTKTQVDVTDYATNLPGDWNENEFPDDFIVTIRTALSLGKAILIHLTDDSAAVGSTVSLTAVDQVIDVED